jgi:hypothetical protein
MELEWKGTYSQLPLGWPATMTRAHSAYLAEAMRRKSESANDSMSRTT